MAYRPIAIFCVFKLIFLCRRESMSVLTYIWYGCCLFQSCGSLVDHKSLENQNKAWKQKSVSACLSYSDILNKRSPLRPQHQLIYFRKFFSLSSLVLIIPSSGLAESYCQRIIYLYNIRRFLAFSKSILYRKTW